TVDLRHLTCRRICRAISCFDPLSLLCPSQRRYCLPASLPAATALIGSYDLGRRPDLRDVDWHSPEKLNCVGLLVELAARDRSCICFLHVPPSRHSPPRPLAIRAAGS